MDVNIPICIACIFVGAWIGFFSAAMCVASGNASKSEKSIH